MPKKEQNSVLSILDGNISQTISKSVSFTAVTFQYVHSGANDYLLLLIPTSKILKYWNKMINKCL